MDLVNRPYKIGMLNLLKDWAKNDDRFPGGWGKIFPNLKDLLLKLAKRYLKN